MNRIANKNIKYIITHNDQQYRKINMLYDKQKAEGIAHNTMNSIVFSNTKNKQQRYFIYQVIR